MAGEMLPQWVTQVGLVAELRWRLFRNALRTWKGRAELIGMVLLAALGGLGALGIGLTLAGGAYLMFERGRPESLGLPLWVVFACWHGAPLVVAGFVRDLDWRNLLRYPMRFPTFVVLSLANGLLDAPSVVAVFWTVCIGAGIVLARPELGWWVLAVLGVFTVVNLLLNRVFLSWLERVLARRRTREVFLVVLLLAISSIQFFGTLADRWGERAEPVVEIIRPVLRVSPPGLARSGLAGAARSEMQGATNALVLLAVWGLAGGLLLRRRLRAEYLGEAISEGAVPAVAEVERNVRPGWQLPGLSGAMVAVAEKELRYGVRNGQTLLSLLMPLVLVVFLGVAWQDPKAVPDILARHPETFFPMSVAYGFLVVAPLLHNTFAFEGKGIQFLLAAPVRMEEVLLAKNLVHGGMILFETLLIWLVVSALVAPPGAGIVALTLAGLVLATLLHFIVGNWLSLQFPRKLEFGQMRKGASEMSVLLGFVTQVVVMGLLGLVYWRAKATGPERWPWLAMGVYLALSAMVLPVYRASLQWSARKALERREVLTAELCR